MMEKAVSYSQLTTTAHWTASVRALESARADRLFHDPWASALAGPEGAAWMAGRTPESVVPIILRTRYFDDFLLRTVARPEIRQIVLLAAGLDTRAFRLTWPEGTRLFELDQPAILDHKEQILAAAGAKPACERQVVPADLAGAWQGRLLKAGFDDARPSLWLLEGFLFYLPTEVITRLLAEVTTLAAPGSWLGFDIVNAAMLVSPWTKPWIEMQAQAGAPWIGTMEDPEGFLAGLGWRASLTQAGAPDAHYGRWTLPVVPTKLPDFPHNWYVTAQCVETLLPGKES